jgi:hypothetical protein
MSPLRGSGAAGASRLQGGQILALVVAVVACRLLAVHSFPIYDDAFITFRYARNLAQGHGLTFNPGQPWEPVLGTTTPAYAVALGGLAWLGFGIENASRGFNVVCDVLSALLLVRLFERRALVSTVAVLAFAAFPIIGRISVGGMEASLLAATALAAVAAGHEGRLVLCGVFAALACTIRPESVLLVMILGVAHVRSRRDLVAYAAPVLGIGALYTGALTYVFGTPIPQSVTAKAGESAETFGLTRTKDVLAQAFGPTREARIVFPLVALGFACSLFSPLRTFVAFAMAMVLAYVASGVKTWGWYFYIPLVSWSIGLALGVQALAALVARRLPRGHVPFALGQHVPLVASVAAVVGMGVFTQLYPDKVSPRVYEPLRLWAEESELRARNASIVASDIGVIGWYGGLILDTEGLVWPEARSYAEQVDVVRAHRPDYVVVVARRERLVRFVADPVFSEYRPVQRFNTTGDADLAPATGGLPAWWEQDYLVYERVEGHSAIE